ncbi:MAG: type II secretion system protein J [Opitutales bacterium]
MRAAFPTPSARRLRTARAGFTLVEILIAMTLSALALTVTASGLLALGKGSESLLNYSEMNTESRAALELLGRHLRSTQDVSAASATGFVITRLDSAGQPQDLRYNYEADKGTLTVTDLATGDAEILLRDVSSLTLAYYTLQQAPTSNALEVKHVQLEAELERQVLSVANRNYIISARFMLRNRRVSN